MIKYACRRDKSPETSARGKVSRLRRGVRPSPMYLISMSSTREISVFIDESGSFSSSEKNPSSPFCLLCMVFHDQGKDIAEEIERLGNSFFLMGLERDHCVHAGPLIRREQSYAHMPREERRAIFQRMLAFVRNAEISYRCFRIDKRRCGSEGAAHDYLLREMIGFLIAHNADFDSFDKFKIYYDNGQAQVKELLREAFAIYSAKVEFISEVFPARYRLFQVADLACAIELVRMKLDSAQRMTESENAFFGGEKMFRKGYLKPLERKLYI